MQSRERSPEMATISSIAAMVLDDSEPNALSAMRKLRQWAKDQKVSGGAVKTAMMTVLTEKQNTRVLSNIQQNDMDIESKMTIFLSAKAKRAEKLLGDVESDLESTKKKAQATINELQDTKKRMVILERNCAAQKRFVRIALSGLLVFTLILVSFIIRVITINNGFLSGIALLIFNVLHYFPQ
jgi:hypothetical protein